MLGLVIRQGVMLAAIGAGIGLVAALASSRLLGTLLFGVTRLDPVTYLGGAFILTAVAVLACWVPARRAASVDPGIALRAD